jgi:hypothetical protein
MDSERDSVCAAGAGGIVSVVLVLVGAFVAAGAAFVVLARIVAAGVATLGRSAAAHAPSTGQD